MPTVGNALASTGLPLAGPHEKQENCWRIAPPAEAPPEAGLETDGDLVGWKATLLEFANQPSKELVILADQGSEWDAPSTPPRLVCRKGEIVVGTGRVALQPAGRDQADGTAPAEDGVWCVIYGGGARREGVVLKSNCRPYGVYDFAVEVPMPDGLPLGLHGEAKIYGLEIEQITTGGMIEKWNLGCTHALMRDIVRVGDVIVTANGYRDWTSMLINLKKTTTAQLCIRRGMDKSDC